MNRTWGTELYSTSRIDNAQDGFSSIELFKTIKDIREKVASVTFWDACGQFSITTFNFDLPIEIVEELIREAKVQIRVQ